MHQARPRYSMLVSAATPVIRQLLYAQRSHVLCSVTRLSGISHRPEMVRVLSDLGCNMQHRSSSNATCLVAVIKEDVDNRTFRLTDLWGRGHSFLSLDCSMLNRGSI